MSQFPTIYAGNRLTSGLLMSMMPTFALKTASTSRTATTTLVNDPDITFSVVANARYTVQGLLLFSADPAADLKIGWTAPTNANFQWSMIGQPTTASAGSGSVITDGQDLTSTSFGLGGVTSNAKVMTAQLRGYLTISATPGTFALQWAQSISNAAATSLLAGTSVTLTRVA